MKNIFTLLFLAAAYFLQAQDTTYYTDTHKKVSTLDSASTYEVKVRTSGDLFVEKTYTKEGKFTQQVDYKDKKINGHYIKYWLNGKLRRDDVYEEDKFISGKCYNHQGQDTTYFAMEIMPEFPGGGSKAFFNYLIKEIHYPDKAKEANIQGKVFVKFVVEKDGSITNVEILKGVNEELNNEAMRVIQKMPKWTSGMEEGYPARVYFNVPISFRLK